MQPSSNKPLIAGLYNCSCNTPTQSLRQPELAPFRKTQPLLTHRTRQHLNYLNRPALARRSECRNPLHQPPCADGLSIAGSSSALSPPESGRRSRSQAAICRSLAARGSSVPCFQRPGHAESGGIVRPAYGIKRRVRSDANTPALPCPLRRCAPVSPGSPSGIRNPSIRTHRPKHNVSALGPARSPRPSLRRAPAPGESPDRSSSRKRSSGNRRTRCVRIPPHDAARNVHSAAGGESTVLPKSFSVYGVCRILPIAERAPWTRPRSLLRKSRRQVAVQPVAPDPPPLPFGPHAPVRHPRAPVMEKRDPDAPDRPVSFPEQWLYESCARGRRRRCPLSPRSPRRSTHKTPCRSAMYY